MAHYAISKTGPIGSGFDVFGPDNHLAGRAETEALAKIWVEKLALREMEIAIALVTGSYREAGRIWKAVEDEARADWEKTMTRRRPEA